MIDNGRLPFEKREHTRAHLKVLTFINPSSCKASTMSGWTQSLSHDGIGVSAKIPSSFKGILQEGEEVEFMIYEDCLKIQGAGKIEWISAGGGMVGIKFNQLSQENKKAVDEVLKLFSAAKPTSNY